jgi:cysteinyl-tRNA synthetase
MDTPKLLAKIFEFRNKYSSIDALVNKDMEKHISETSLIKIDGNEIDKIKENLFVVYYFEKNLLRLGLFETIVEENFDVPAEVTVLADQRLEAKQAKDYTRADEIRKEILDR